MAQTTILVGNGGKMGKGRTFRFILLLVAVVVVAGGLGASLRWWQHKQQGNAAVQPSAAVKTIAEQAQGVAMDGDPAKAHQMIQSALDSGQLSADSKYTLLFQDGITYENQQQYDSAITSYEKADAIKPTRAVAEAIARTAQEKGDKTLAITYYQKAISRLSANDPLSASTKTFYQQQIAALEGKS